MWLKIIKEAVVVMIISIILAGAGYALHPVFKPSDPEIPGDGGPAQNDVEYKEITLAQAQAHFDNETALFADARSQRAFVQGHIKGALNLDPKEFDTWSGDFFSRISPDQTIVTYCDGPQCSLGRELADKLNWMGYEKVYYLKNGWGLWTENKLPTESTAE